MGFMDKMKEEMKKAADRQAAEAAKNAERRRELDEQGVAYCPKCLSTSLSAQKKGGSIVKGLVGGAIAGPVGLLAGGIGRNKIDVVCMKCGNKFRA